MQKRLVVLVAWIAASCASAQTYVQSYELERFSFSVQSSTANRPSSEKTRCIQWQALAPNTKQLLDYESNGKPILRVRVTANTLENCTVKFSDPNAVRLLTQSKQKRVYEFDVRPPLTVISATSGGHRDDLIFEAPVQQTEHQGRFAFIRNSELSFLGMSSWLNSSRRGSTTATAGVFPVFGGTLGVPIPYIPNTVFTFSMFQNLGNLLQSSNSSRTQVSETSFGVKYNFRGSEQSGRWKIAPAFEFRSRNIYQTSAERPFILGSILVPLVGLDSQWFPGAVGSPWSGAWSRLGLDLRVRWIAGVKVQNNAHSTLGLQTGLLYRVTKKWALGAGWHYVQSKQDVEDLSLSEIVPVSETSSSFYLKLSLLPFLTNEEGKTR